MTPAEHRAVCEICEYRIFYARAFDMHFGWCDCWYDCPNDYEHHQAEEEKKDEPTEVTQD